MGGAQVQRTDACDISVCSSRECEIVAGRMQEQGVR